MDLRSIIHSDSTSNPPPRPRPSLDSPIKQVYPNHPPPYQSSYDGHPSGLQGAPHSHTRPPQPPPIQPPGHRELQSPSGSLSHRSAQSPYQQTPTSSLSGSQYPFPQPPPHHPQIQANYGPQNQQWVAIAPPGSQGVGQISPPVLTPISTTPGSTYPQQQYHRPHSSQSSATPTSAQSYAQTFPRGSPHFIPSHNNVHPPTFPTQHYQSQPGTPLGPPQSMGKPSPALRRDSTGPSSREHYRTQSGSSYNYQQNPTPSPMIETPTVLASPGSYSSRPLTYQRGSYQTDEERERSLSVSPKTRLPSQTKLEHRDVTPESDMRWGGSGVTPAKRKLNDDSPQMRPVTQTSDHNQLYHDHDSGFGNSNGLVKQEPREHTKYLSDVQAHPQQGTIAPLPYTMSILDQQHLANFHGTSTQQASATPSRQQPPTPQVLSNHSNAIPHTSTTPPSAIHAASPLPISSGASSFPQTMANTSSPSATASLQQPMRKKQRFESPPVYAQSSRKVNRAGIANPFLPNKRSAVHRPAAPVKQERMEPGDQGPQQAPLPLKEPTNGHSTPTVQVVLSKALPISPTVLEVLGGQWEFNIKNMLPQEDLSRRVADFLFQEVVNRRDIGTGPAGGGSVSGAVVEIEAKLGQIIDRNTNDRIQLPVVTECIVSRGHPNLRTAFKSSMTEDQHRAMNKYLNDALVESHPKNPPIPAKNPIIPSEKSRVPMNYVHTKESDSFYELSQQAVHTLPPAIRVYLDSRHNKAKVRITTDQKTGQELARIVKVRCADLDIYNPGTEFDYRISVNLEMQFEGDTMDLVEIMEGGKRAPERNKDRVSYRHLCYQIDLTQVSPAEATPNASKEHELEIEVSGEKLREHGLLLAAGQPSGYEDIVRGFLDNARLLTRLFPRPIA